MQRTLVLDLDGTLVDSVDDLSTALNTVLATRALRAADRREVTGLIGNGAHALLTGAFAARGVAFDGSALSEFLTYYTANSAIATRPFPGTIEMLREMAARDWRFAICTNKPEAAARALLGELGLDRWFAAIGGGDSFAVRKPDPAHLLATLASAGGVVAGAVMSGDHANDVNAARGAGIPCIFAAWGYGSRAMAEGAAAIAASITDLPALCERLVPAPRG